MVHYYRLLAMDHVLWFMNHKLSDLQTICLDWTFPEGGQGVKVIFQKRQLQIFQSYLTSLVVIGTGRFNLMIHYEKNTLFASFFISNGMW